VCGRYTLTTRKSDEIQARLLETLRLEAPPPDSSFERFNIAPTQEVLAVVDDRDGRRSEELRWGLVPHWSKELNTRFSMINARAVTLDQGGRLPPGSSRGRTFAA
jgi:putative SOS response-associated peptidase YedK